MVCFWNYDSQNLNLLVFVNNSCLGNIIHAGTTFSKNSEFIINGCSFFNNFKYQTTEYLQILSSQQSDSKITFLRCQTDTTFPSNSAYTYTDSKENVIYNNIDILLWNFKNISIITTPPQSEGFICKINPKIPWPTSTPPPSQSYSPIETPTESPSASLTETPTQSLFATLTQSPTQTPTQSPTKNPTASASISSLPLFSPFPTETLLPTDIIYTDSRVIEKGSNAGLICGVIFAILAIIIIIILIIFCLKKKRKLCFRNKYSSPLSSIDLLESNPPFIDSTQSELMSGKEDVFSKTPHNDVFNYSLII